MVDAVRPQVNVELLRKTLEHITAHPEEWDQGIWARRDACGTALCAAGHAVQIAGHKLHWVACCDSPDCGALARAITAAGELRPIPDVAREELGLTKEQGDWLFGGLNSLPDLWEIANYYTDGAIEVPPGMED